MQREKENADQSPTFQHQWALLVPYGEHLLTDPESEVKRRTKVDSADAVEMVENLPKTGVPFVVGHPFSKWRRGVDTDGRAYGWITKMEARPGALWGSVRWNHLGIEAIQGEWFGSHSPSWRTKEEGGIDRPYYLKSVGFTNSPAIPGIPAIRFKDPV